MLYCFLEITALSVKRLSHTSTIAFVNYSVSDLLIFKYESNRPAPAIFERSSRVELDLTANNVSSESSLRAF
jgi:hypothetical protein